MDRQIGAQYYTLRNFAKTMPKMLTGDVSSICSVRVFRSSEKSFIVRMGMSTVNINSITVKYTDESVVRIQTVVKEKMTPEMARSTAANIYPVGDVRYACISRLYMGYISFPPFYCHL